MSYTYLLGWSKLNKFYYGVRFAKNCQPSDLFVTYFTSSKYVKEFIKNNGNPDIIQIRKTFESSDKARLWENRVLKKMQVIKDVRWLNKTDNLSISVECCKYEHTDEIKLKKSLSHIGKKHSDKVKKKISESQKGKPRLYMLGKKRPEHSAKMKELQRLGGGFALKNKNINLSNINT